MHITWRKLVNYLILYYNPHFPQAEIICSYCWWRKIANLVPHPSPPHFDSEFLCFTRFLSIGWCLNAVHATGSNSRSDFDAKPQPSLCSHRMRLSQPLGIYRPFGIQHPAIAGMRIPLRQSEARDGKLSRVSLYVCEHLLCRHCMDDDSNNLFPGLKY